MLEWHVNFSIYAWTQTFILFHAFMFLQDEWLNDWSQFDNRSIGVCYCTVYHVWSEEDMECWHPEAPAIPPPWAIAIAVGVVLLLIVKLAILLKLMI